MLEDYIKKLEQENRLLHKQNGELEKIAHKRKQKILIMYENNSTSQINNLPTKLIQNMDVVLKFDKFKEDRKAFYCLKNRIGRQGIEVSLDEVMELYA